MQRFLLSGVLFFTLLLVIVVPVFAQQTALDPQYCGGPNNDYYVIPGEPEYGGKPCSRAPNACGNDYDSINTIDIMPDYNACMGNGEAEREEKGCAGIVPACCYEMARTGDFTKCVGYWERNWCARSQCDEARSKGASDSQCGGSGCQCSHALSTYCGSDTQPVSLSSRIAGATDPTNTPTPTVTPTPPLGATNTPTPTLVPNATATPTPSGQTCEQMKLAGNYNCQGSVDESDYTSWKTDFLAKTSSLAFFEYWRRAMYQ